MLEVLEGRPDSRTILTAAATASWTLALSDPAARSRTRAGSEGSPVGWTEKATIMPPVSPCTPDRAKGRSRVRRCGQQAGREGAPADAATRMLPGEAPRQDSRIVHGVPRSEEHTSALQSRFDI